MAEQKTDTPTAAPAPHKLSKTDAVRKSFARLGKKAMPKAVQQDVKKTYGLDVSANHISSIKAELAGKPGAKKPAPKKAAANPPVKKVEAPKAASAVPSANGKQPLVSIEDVLTLKAIVGRVGASHVKTLIDGLSM
jgi:hypothetical protein